jgi:TRAP-type C4-dicarboxylate transport system permease small subunit
MTAFNRIVDAIAALVRVVILLQAAAIFAIIIVTVVTRYGFSYVLSWSEEVPRYLLIWVSFLGAAKGMPARLRSRHTLVLRYETSAVDDASHPASLPSRPCRASLTGAHGR